MIEWSECWHRAARTPHYDLEQLFLQTLWQTRGPNPLMYHQLPAFLFSQPFIAVRALSQWLKAEAGSIWICEPSLPHWHCLRTEAAQLPVQPEANWATRLAPVTANDWLVYSISPLTAAVTEADVIGLVQHCEQQQIGLILDFSVLGFEQTLRNSKPLFSVLAEANIPWLILDNSLSAPMMHGLECSVVLCAEALYDLLSQQDWVMETFVSSLELSLLIEAWSNELWWQGYVQRWHSHLQQIIELVAVAGWQPLQESVWDTTLWLRLPPGQQVLAWQHQLLRVGIVARDAFDWFSDTQLGARFIGLPLDISQKQQREMVLLLKQQLPACH